MELRLCQRPIEAQLSALSDRDYSIGKFFVAPFAHHQLWRRNWGGTFQNRPRGSFGQEEWNAQHRAHDTSGIRDLFDVIESSFRARHPLADPSQRLRSRSPMARARGLVSSDSRDSGNARDHDVSVVPGIFGRSSTAKASSNVAVTIAEGACARSS